MYRDGDEVVMVYFKIPSQNFPGGAKENLDRPQ
jgi:hypothetical protein